MIKGLNALATCLRSIRNSDLKIRIAGSSCRPQLTTPKNTITYHNALCLSPQILHKHCFQFLLGPNAYAKFWSDKQRALWYVMVFSGVVNTPTPEKTGSCIDGIQTRTHLEVVNKNESILSPLELANSATELADFLVFYLKFFRCSNVSVGTNVGRTVKPSPNAESTVGKFLKWFSAASLAVFPFSLSSSICLANFALYSEDRHWVMITYS